MNKITCEDFVGKLKSGAYAKIDARYFQLLWKVLQQSPKKKLSAAVKDDFFACLARGGGQMDLIRQCAKEEKSFGLDSPFAKVFFNLFGKARNRRTRDGMDLRLDIDIDRRRSLSLYINLFLNSSRILSQN